jgi:hypothetical protein
MLPMVGCSTALQVCVTLDLSRPHKPFGYVVLEIEILVRGNDRTDLISVLLLLHTSKPYGYVQTG